MNATANATPGATAISAGVPSNTTVAPQLAELEAKRRALEEQRRMLDEQEAQLRREAEEAIRQKVVGLPAYLGVADMNAVQSLIRSVLTIATKGSAPRKRGGRNQIPEDIKDAIDKALRAGATTPSVVKHFSVSPAWVAIRKRKLKLTGRKNLQRRSVEDILAEQRGEHRTAA